MMEPIEYKTEAYAAEDRRRYRRAIGAWATATRRAIAGKKTPAA